MSQSAGGDNITDLFKKEFDGVEIQFMEYTATQFHGTEIHGGTVDRKALSLIHRATEHWGYPEKAQPAACPMRVLFPGDPLLGTFGDLGWCRWTFGLHRMAALCN